MEISWVRSFEEFRSRKDPQPTKSGQRTQILVKPDFGDLRDSKLSRLRTINGHFIESKKWGKNEKGWLCVHETPILEAIFVTLSENSYAVTKNTQGPRETLPCATWH